MPIEMTGNAGGGPADAVVGLDGGNPLEALADALGEAFGVSPEPGSAFAPVPSKAPEWSIEAGS